MALNLKYLPLIASLLAITFPFQKAIAQLTPDNTLGAENSVVVPINSLVDQIQGGAARGSNLFHSFSEFNIDAGRSVYFANPATITNILTRVTGGNPSDIFGTLGVSGNANLILINPNGIYFGPNAKLDMGGSFTATTADGVMLGDNTFFSATDISNSSLLSIQPGALFNNALRNHQAEINQEGNLAVEAGQSLTLQGDQVSLSGSLTALEGKVEVLGNKVALLDDASIDVSGGGTALIGGNYQGQGDTPTASRTFVGSDVTINADGAVNGDGGTVVVWADEITGFYGSISARGGSESGDGGLVEVSGKENLIFRGHVDTLATKGVSGTLL